MMDVVSGNVPGDPYVAPALSGSFCSAISRPPGPLRVAVAFDNLNGKAIHPECRKAVEEAARLLEALGHHVEEAAPEADIRGMMAAWTRIVACGTASWVRSKAKTQGRAVEQGEIEPTAVGAIRYAENVSGADYLDSVNKVHAFGREMAPFFERHDILLTATLAEPPAEIGRYRHVSEDFEAYRMGPGGVFDYSPFTALFNATGQPAASLPTHWTPDGLPVGIHLAAPFGADELLIALSVQIEAANPWFDKRPPAENRFQ